MNIGLVAMSGIRICDEELLKMGFTLPGFVERSQVIASLPSLSLLTLAGMTSPKHNIKYFEVADLKQSMSEGNLPENFDLVAISTLGPQIEDAYKLAEFYRQKSIKVVMGGLQVTTVPGEAQKYCDAVVVGEGELWWNQILDDAEQGNLKPLYGDNKSEFDLANAPMPAFELLEIEKYNRLTVQTSRGCPRRCEFCASSILLTKKYKQKPIEKVLAEIDRIKEIWETPFIEFADDNSFINIAYWKELLPQLRSRRIHWFTETDISVASDHELLRLMRRSGCSQVLIGLESPTKNELRGLDNNSNWKMKQWTKYKDAIKTIQGHGISVNGCFIVGLDGHEKTIFDNIIEFVESSGLHEVQITLPTAFPGTPFYERLLHEQRLIEKENWSKLTLFDLNFTPSNMTFDELRDGFKKLAKKLYSDEFTQLRRKNFRACQRAGRTKYKISKDKKYILNHL